MTKKNYIGKNVNRVDAIEKVKGATKYGSDLKCTNMCYGKILYSAHPRAKIVQIDIAKALNIPKVKKIITYRDIEGKNTFGYDVHHRPLLIKEGEETRFLGDALALVVAETESAAMAALRKIKVIYDVLPPLHNPRTALEEKEYFIHKEANKSVYKSIPEAFGNICFQTKLVHGNVVEALKDCDVIVEHTYITPRQEHAFLETECGLAYVNSKGVLKIFSATQDPDTLLEDISFALNIPKSKIHVKGIPTGGAFGGKLNNTIQVHLAAMAHIAKVPVKVVLSREESFFAHPKRHTQEIRIKIGSDHKGDIKAIEAKLLADAGPYSSRTPEVFGLTVSAIVGPYSIPNIHVEGKAVYTNNIDADAFRGFGAPQAAVAREGIIDKLARKLGINPLELRKNHFLKNGEKSIAPLRGESSVSLEMIADRLDELMGPLPKLTMNSEQKIGRAYCFDMPVFDVSAIPVLGKSGVGATVEVFSDASAVVYAGGCEMGQGITTILAQIAAENLCIPLENIHVEMTDTWTCPPSGRTSASRGTYVNGNAVLLASDKIKKTLLKRAAKAMNLDTQELIMEDGKISSIKSHKKSILIEDVTKLCANEGIKLREDGWYLYPEAKLMYGHTFMGTAAEVSVDILTGEIKITKLVNVHDSGKVINPSAAAGQQIGGSIQALGYALMENFIVQNCSVLTPSLMEYLIPTSLDVPEKMYSESLQTEFPKGPYGAKGLAEHSLNTTAPAILNAISNAIDCDFKEFPIFSEHILMALKGKNNIQKEA